MRKNLLEASVTNTLQLMEVSCREGCSGTATVVRKYWRDEEVPPVFAECALGCAHIILTEEQVAEAIEFYRIEVRKRRKRSA